MQAIESGDVARELLAPPRREPIQGIVIEGGGTHGLSAIAAIDELWQHLDFSELRHVVGTSAGALAGTGIALGLKPRDLLAVARAYPWRNFVEGQARRGGWLSVLFGAEGMCRLDGAKVFLTRLFQAAGMPADVTFADLERITGRDLMIVAWGESFNAERVPEGIKIFSARRTPWVKVIEAALASMAVPFLFDRVEISGRRYSDGGLFWNYAWPVLDLESVPRSACIGVRVDPEIAPDTAYNRSTRRWWRRLIMMARGRLRARSYTPPEWEERTISCRVPDYIDEFDLLAAEKHGDDLIRAGRAGTLEKLREWGVLP